MQKKTYLIDTDWVIDYLNGNDRVVRKLNKYRKRGLAISMITFAEIYEGIYYSRDPKQNEEGFYKFLSEVLIMGIDEKICRLFAKERGRLRKNRAIIGDFDLIIAATGLKYNMILLTNNEKHFKRIENLKIESIK